MLDGGIREATHQLVAALEARCRHLCNRVLFMVCFFGRDDGSKSGKGEVNTGEPGKWHVIPAVSPVQCGDLRNQVGLEFVQINVQGSIETQRRGD